MAVYLIRHGQSEFNAVHKDGDPDPMIFDAPLTSKGLAQARQARIEVAKLGISQVIASPLTRAIQTALCIFRGVAPIKIMSGHRELLSHSCDVGRPASRLKLDFPELSFDDLDEIWWHQGPATENGVPVEPRDVFQQRIRSFASELDGMAGQSLAVVGHGDSFRELAGVSMANCEVYRFSG